MSDEPRPMRSPYMEFAKLRSAARFNLATSGLMSYPLAQLPVRLEELEINGPTGYGYQPLQQRLAARNGVGPECVVAATGTSMANHLAMAALLQPGDEVIIEEPTYELLLTVARYLGAKVRSFSRRHADGFHIDPEDVRRQVTPQTRLIVITNLHNPSGALADEVTLRALGDIATEAKARVLVDEVYLEEMFGEAPRSSFHLGSQFVVTSSLTKAYGLSGLRCGWILAEAPLAERMWRLNDLFAATPAHPAERLSVIALEHLHRISAWASNILTINRRAVKTFLDSRRDLECVWPAYGTVAFPRLQRGDADVLFRLLRDKYDTSIVPGSYFGAPRHFRIGMGGDPEMTATGLQRLGQALYESA